MTWSPNIKMDDRKSKVRHRFKMSKKWRTCFPSWYDSHSKAWRALSSRTIFNFNKWGWPKRLCKCFGGGDEKKKTQMS